MSGIALLAYAFFVAAGIGGIAYLLHRTGHGRAAVLEEGEARRLLEERTGQPVTGPPFITETALLFALEGGVGVVRAQGRFPLVRIIGKEDVRDVQARAGGLRLRLSGFDDPALILRTQDPQALRDWLAAAGLAEDAGAR